MTGYSKKTTNRIRITVLICLLILNAVSALLIALSIDSIPLEAWPVWITFLLNMLFLMLMAYANGWMYGTALWWEREIRVKGYTCTDCVYKNRCMERSRNYCCTNFLPKEREKDHEGNEKQRRIYELGAGRQSYQHERAASGGQN